jgi:hypothetical protein
VGQEALGGGCKRVGKMGVGLGVWSWATIRADKVDVHPLGGLGKCWVGAPHLHEGLGVGKGS